MTCWAGRDSKSMEHSSAPRGLIVDLITPLKNGAIDGTGLKKLLARVLPHAQALLLAGPRHGGGERMEMAMRDELLKKTIDAATDRPVSLFVWVSGKYGSPNQTEHPGAARKHWGKSPGRRSFLGGHTPCLPQQPWTSRLLSGVANNCNRSPCAPQRPGLCAYHPNF